MSTHLMIHIFPKVGEVSEYNQQMQNKLNPNFQTHYASHAFSSFNATPGGQVAAHLIPDDDRHAGGL